MNRTYEGAYVRAAFANLIYALIILKLFSADFSRSALYVLSTCVCGLI